MQEQAQQIIERCKKAFEIAERLYGVDMSNVAIRFDLKGRAAGQAYRRSGQYGMRFNRDMLTREAFDHVLNNTVPHEVAHLVCFMSPVLGQNHDSGWQRICISLGGTGKRGHPEEVVYGKGTTYEYITDRGQKVRVGDRHHKHIQAGGLLRYKKGLGTVSQFSAYSIVGVSGRTLANPIVKQAPNSAANVEAGYQQIRAFAEREAERRAAAAATQTTTPAAAPAASPVNRVQSPLMGGESKATISRRIMLSGFKGGRTYEEIISAMMAANGFERQLARAYFKNNAAKVGIPESFYA